MLASGALHGDPSADARVRRSSASIARRRSIGREATAAVALRWWGGSREAAQRACGVDALQALALGLALARTCPTRPDLVAEGRLTWLGQDDLGIPPVLPDAASTWARLLHDVASPRTRTLPIASPADRC
jgi:hypothetical protein